MKLLSSPAVVAMCLAAGAQAGHAAVLDFNYTLTPLATSASSGLGAVLPAGSGGWISQSYGDVPGLVDVSYRYFNTTDVNESSLQTWVSGYDDLTFVAWNGAQGGSDRAEVGLASVGGSLVTLSSFALGSWAGTGGRQETVTVREIGGGVVFSQTLLLGVNDVSTTFAINASSTSGFLIGWTSPWWTAIDNIDSSAAPIPEPGTWALMGLGLAGVVTLARRRRTPA